MLLRGVLKCLGGRASVLTSRPAKQNVLGDALDATGLMVSSSYQGLKHMILLRLPSSAVSMLIAKHRSPYFQMDRDP